MNHLIDFGVCALVGCTNYISFTLLLLKYIQVRFGCSDLMVHCKSPIIRIKAKRKVQYCKTVKWAKRVWTSINIGKTSPL